MFELRFCHKLYVGLLFLTEKRDSERHSDRVHGSRRHHEVRPHRQVQRREETKALDDAAVQPTERQRRLHLPTTHQQERYHLRVRQGHLSPVTPHVSLLRQIYRGRKSQLLPIYIQITRYFNIVVFMTRS